MNIETIETYQDFDLLSDERPTIGSVIFIDNKKYIIAKTIDRRVYHHSGNGIEPGYNPDLTKDQGWMRHRIIVERVID
jgi:hypothetical protein